MTFGSVCSGIEAASVAWEPLGMRAVFVSEIDPAPSAVLAHRFPGVPNLGDFTRIESTPEPIEILVGGTPCQSFSVAGLRGGMADERGNLALEFLRLAGRLRPRWMVWENVSGVLSSNRGRDFGSFLGGLAELGYGFAYRVLDAQHFGVPQRRRRVFVVGHLGDWRRAASVLFERKCLSNDPPPSRSQRPDNPGNFAVVPIDLRQASRGEKLTNYRANGSGGPPGIGIGDPGDPAFTVSERGQAIAFQTRGRADGRNLEWSENISYALRAIDGGGCGDWFRIAFENAARRLMPREAERLQGFPDDWTLVPYRGKAMADGPRYKIIGNSMAVPVMRWIGQRIMTTNHFTRAER